MTGAPRAVGTTGPRVTILTPTRDARRFLAECRRSVEAQYYPMDRIEHIVLDGGSTDGTLELARSMTPGIVLEADTGTIYEALNRGVARAKGDIVGWLNADEVLHPDAISAVVRAFERRPDADIAVGDFELWTDEGAFTRRSRSDALQRLRQGRRRGTWIFPIAVFFRTEFLRGMGGYSTEYRLAADRELWLRIAASDSLPKIVHTGTTLGRFRVHDGSLSHGTDRTTPLRENVRLYDGYRDDPKVPDGVRRHARALSRQNRLWLEVAEARPEGLVAMTRAVLHAMLATSVEGPEGLSDLVEGLATNKLPATRLGEKARRVWYGLFDESPYGPD
ncbi:MAG: glycosyltransferase family 2 protein [Polyangiaceae bacterium]